MSTDRHACIENTFSLGRVQIGRCHTLTGNVWFQLQGSVAGRKHLKLNWEVKERSSELTSFYGTKCRR